MAAFFLPITSSVTIMSGLQLMSIMDMTDITCCYVLDVGQSTAVIGCVIIPVLGVIKALLATARLPALMHLFIRSFVCLSVCLSPKHKNAIFSEN